MEDRGPVRGLASSEEGIEYCLFWVFRFVMSSLVIICISNRLLAVLELYLYVIRVRRHR